MSLNKSVYLLYGLGEGPVIARNFIKAAKAGGYTISSDIKKADIVFAHSGGCYLIVPAKTSAKLVILNGIPYWPAKPILKSVAEKIRFDYYQKKRSDDVGFWVRKTIWNNYYMLRHPVNGYKMWKGWRNKTLPLAVKNQKIIAVKNADDPFSTQAIYKELASVNNWQVLELRGGHDEVWDDPAPVLKLMDAAL